MAWAYLIPLAMQMMQQQGQQGGQSGDQGMQVQGWGGVPFGNNMNYFNPPNGPSYSSQNGMLGMGAPSAGGGGGANWMGMLGNMGGMSSPVAGRMGGIANGLFNIFGAKNPSDAAEPYLEKIEGSMGKYLNPYIDAGMKALPTLQDQYGQLINNPGAVMSKIGAGFQASPGYQFQVDQALGAANRAAAAGGMAGTPQEQQQIASTVNQLANQDYWNYENHGLDLYGQGMGGLSHIFDTGFNGAGMMSQGVMQALMAMAQNKYAGANTYNQQMGGGISSLIGGIF